MSDCPGAAHGHSGYVPGRGNLATAEFFYLGEAPGASEVAWKRCPTCRWEGEESNCPQCRGASTLEALPSPFVGKSGKLARKMLRSAGIDPSRVYFTNVIKCRPPDNKYPTGQVRVACEGHCQGTLIEELRQFAENQQPAKAIIAAGSQALRALTGLDSITQCRGYVYLASEDFAPVLPLDYLPVVIPTIHPSFIFRAFDVKQDSDDSAAQQSWLPITVGDYIKAARIVQTRQLRRPPSIWRCDSVTQLVPQNGWRDTDHVTLDLEYTGDQIGIVGLGYGDSIGCSYFSND